MKMNIKNWLTGAAFLAGALLVSVSADAQRNHGGGGGGGSRGGGGGSFHGGGGGVARSYSAPSFRGAPNGGNRGGVTRQPVNNYRPGNGYASRQPVNNYRPGNGNVSRQPVNNFRPGTGYGNRPVNNFRPGSGNPAYRPGRVYPNRGGSAGRYTYNGRYGYAGGYFGRGYGGYHGGYTHYTSINFGGIGYHYYNGYFYRPYGYGFGLIYPPFGIHIGYLPYGYYPFYIGADPYYYYGGTFYQPYGSGEYQVVAPPLNSLVPQLPQGAQLQQINGQPYYVYYGTIYREEVRDNGETWYRVVGTNGQLAAGADQYEEDNQYQPAPQNEQQEPQVNPSSPSTNAPRIGDMVYTLPANCKQLTISGQQYFLSPDGDYYQEVVGDDNKVMYQIVNKPDQEDNN